MLPYPFRLHAVACQYDGPEKLDLVSLGFDDPESTPYPLGIGRDRNGAKVTAGNAWYCFGDSSQFTGECGAERERRASGGSGRNSIAFHLRTWITIGFSWQTGMVHGVSSQL